MGFINQTFHHWGKPSGNMIPLLIIDIILWFTVDISLYNSLDAPCVVYLPTKLGHLWGRCW